MPRSGHVFLNTTKMIAALCACWRMRYGSSVKSRWNSNLKASRKFARCPDPTASSIVIKITRTALPE